MGYLFAVHVPIVGLSLLPLFGGPVFLLSIHVVLLELILPVRWCSRRSRSLLTGCEFRRAPPMRPCSACAPCGMRWRSVVLRCLPSWGCSSWVTSPRFPTWDCASPGWRPSLSATLQCCNGSVAAGATGGAATANSMVCGFLCAR